MELHMASIVDIVPKVSRETRGKNILPNWISPI